ncbi:MAG: patatin-like phospholipase family protein [Planctomycetota bacterium]
MCSDRSTARGPHRAIRPFALFAALVLANAGDVHAARQEEPHARPRVGLVLSGGGARGAAHVGVIEVLERLHVPVDLVVGTSMGSIVGGLYASGYSPEEMREIVESADWAQLFSDVPPRDQLWFRRRQDDREFQVDVQLGWKDGGPVFPPGLVQGRNVESYLEQLTLPVAGVRDFDALRIPFRCVATDLGDGSAVVLGDGSLARAIRASMSLPGIFAPVEHEGRLLVDGGAVDNVPIDVARDLGADVVIVVDISTPLGEISRLASPFGISNQVVGILMQQNRTRSMALVTEGDVAIVPELGTISVLAFERSGEAIDIGRAAAEALAEELSAYASDGAAFDAFLARQRRPEAPAPRVHSVVVDERTRLAASVLRRRVVVREGRPLDGADLAETRERLAGLGIFSGVDVDLLPSAEAPGELDVVVRPVEKPWGPNYLRFALGVSSDLTGGGDFVAGVQHTSTPVNAYGGEWRNEVLLGTATRIGTEFYQPLDAGLRWFVAPSLTFGQTELLVTIDGKQVAAVDADVATAELAVGRNLGDWGELRTSYGYEYGTIRPSIVLPGLLPAKVDVRSAVFSAALTADTLDSVTFPRSGFACAVEFTSRGSSVVDDDRTETVQASFGLPVTWRRLTLRTSLAGGVTVRNAEELGSSFTLGGFRRLSGVSPNGLSGNHFAIATIEPYVRLGETSGAFGLAKYLGATIEYGGVWQERDALGSDDLLLAGSIYLGLDTLFGPVFVGVGAAEGGEHSVFVFLGPLF